MKHSDLKIGTKIYQYSSPCILEYEVIKINTLESENHNEKFYILKCLSCRDHDQCILAVNFSDNGELKYSHMINNYDEDDDEYYEEHEHYRNHQSYWHKCNMFFLDRNDAVAHIYKENIKHYENKILELNATLSDTKEKLEKTKTELSVLND